MQLANALPGGLAAGVRQGPRFARFFRMTRIAFFGHDAADAAVRRRVQGFRDDGLDVVGFTMRRRDDVVTDGGIPKDVTRNAPASEDDFFMVPKVVE